MYRIIKNGDVIALADKPFYIKLSSSGLYTTATEQDAQGVAIDGTPYNLIGREPMSDSLETVMAVSFDSGSTLQNVSTLAADAAPAIALAELAEAIEAQNTENQLAIAELAELIGG